MMDTKQYVALIQDIVQLGTSNVDPKYTLAVKILNIVNGLLAKEHVVESFVLLANIAKNFNNTDEIDKLLK